ncbi:MAG: alpha/beta hydrolase [Deltaproteobacteria bacterium]|nr:alpha/beta hydrolase [Deltaproteobacteria bacterium]
MFIELPDLTLHYKASGQGSPIVLLHGNGEDCSIFDELSEKLSSSFAVYALDSRCHGLSQATATISYSAMSGDLRSFITRLELQPVNVVGFSDGAVISLLLAMDHPELIRRMALLGPNLDVDDFIPEIKADLEEEYAANRSPLIKLMLDEPHISSEEVRQIKIPSLVVGGENDLFKPGTFETIAAALVDSRLMVLKDHDHMSYIVHNDLLYPELADFFKC